MREPLVSIIVPVCNSGKFLRDCLDSLLAQELPSCEIICINDGSTDCSGKILEEYARNHPEIQVITQKNSGVSAARNRGLSLARGTYVCFCDSDDCLAAGILGQAAEQMVIHGAELCFFHIKRVPEAYRYCHEQAASECSLTIGISEEIRRNLYIFLFLISREFLTKHALSFHTGLAYSEDELFVVDLLKNALPEKVLHLHRTGYIHRKNPDSVMNAPKFIRAPRHYEAMRIFAMELRTRAASDAAMQREIRRRMDQAVSNALYDGFYMEKAPKEILAELTADGLYPYPLCREMLNISDFKTTLSNYIRFLFPIRGYYLFVCSAVRMGFKLLKKG